MFNEISAFSNAIDEIQDHILEMGALVEKEMLLAVESLVYSKSEQIQQVYDMDMQVDCFDHDIQESVTQLIMIQPPLPRELKALTTMMRMSRELERFGDHSVNIAEVSQSIQLDITGSESLRTIHQMSESTLEILAESMQAFRSKNIEGAKKIVEKDHQINQLYKQVQNQLIQEMKADPESIEAYAQLFVVNRFLERSADHVVNISRRVKDCIY